MRHRPQAVSAIAKAKPVHTTLPHIGVSTRRCSLSRTYLDSANAVDRQNT